MTKRSERYHVVVDTINVFGSETVSVFSRRPDAIKRAKIIAKTWDRAIKVEVKDTVTFFGERILFTWSRYTKAQINAAIDAEANAWGEFFGNVDLEGRKQVQRANVAVNFLAPLVEFLVKLAKNEPTHLYVGKRENILAEVGDHNSIYEGRYLVCPVGEPQFDSQGAANITEVRALVEEYRSHYPTIAVCYV